MFRQIGYAFANPLARKSCFLATFESLYSCRARKIIMERSNLHQQSFFPEMREDKREPFNTLVPSLSFNFLNLASFDYILPLPIAAGSHTCFAVV